MIKVLIVDDETVRIERITRFAHGLVDGRSIEVEHQAVVPRALAGFDLIFLDHDLGPAGDVYDNLRGRSEFSGLQDTVVVVHSMNPVGARNIAELLRPHAASCLIRPFSSMA